MHGSVFPFPTSHHRKLGAPYLAGTGITFRIRWRGTSAWLLPHQRLNAHLPRPSRPRHRGQADERRPRIRCRPVAAYGSDVPHLAGAHICTTATLRLCGVRLRPSAAVARSSSQPTTVTLRGPYPTGLPSPPLCDPNFTRRRIHAASADERALRRRGRALEAASDLPPQAGSAGERLLRLFG